jgi:hypothetical protein
MELNYENCKEFEEDLSEAEVSEITFHNRKFLVQQGLTFKVPVRRTLL